MRSVVSIKAVLITALAAATVNLGQDTAQKIDNKISSTIDQAEVPEQKEKKKKAPPYNGQEFERDPKKPPAEGFEWRGKGKPGSKQGAWHNPETDESLRADFDHAPPIGPHWDYTKNGETPKTRLFLDGTWDTK